MIGITRSKPERRWDGDALGPLVAFEQPAGRLGRGRGAGAGRVAFAGPLGVPGGDRQVADDLERARTVPTVMARLAARRQLEQGVDRRRRHGGPPLAAEAGHVGNHGLLDQPPLRVLDADEPDRNPDHARRPPAFLARSAGPPRRAPSGRCRSATTAPSPTRSASRADPGGRASQSRASAARRRVRARRGRTDA